MKQKTQARASPAAILAAGAGMSIKTVCKRANICEPYFERMARRGNAPFYTAQRLAHILSCSPMVFLYGLHAHTGAIGKNGPVTSPGGVAKGAEFHTAQSVAKTTPRRRSRPLQLVD